MRRGLPSFSQVERAESCPLAWALPHAPLETEHAGRGRAVHTFCCALADGASREHALTLVPEEHREWCEAIDVRALPLHREARAEWAYAWDYVTRQGRELGRVDRDYAVLGTEFPGTADLEFVSRDRVEINDYKTGRAVTSAKENLQLAGLALAAARAHSRSKAIVRLVYLREDGRTQKDEFELSEWDLELVEARLVRIAERVLAAQEAAERGEHEARMGDHCGYCPALPYCPAHLALARVATDSIPSMVTSEIVAEAWERAHALERIAKRMKEACGAYAMNWLVPLGGDKVLGPVSTKKRSINVDLARPILGDLFGVEVADAAIKQSMTQAAIRRALLAYRPDLDVNEAMREAMAEMEAAEAVVVTRSTAVKVHKRGADAGEDEEEG